MIFFFKVQKIEAKTNLGSKLQIDFICSLRKFQDSKSKKRVFSKYAKRTTLAKGKAPVYTEPTVIPESTAITASTPWPDTTPWLETTTTNA